MCHLDFFGDWGKWENWDRVFFYPGKKRPGPNFPIFSILNQDKVKLHSKFDLQQELQHHHLDVHLHQ